MTAANDMQDGINSYKELEAALKVRFPDESELRIDDFMNVEAALTLATHLGGAPTDPNKVDRLLSNYPLIRPEKFGADEHLMQMARRHLFRLTSSMTWRRAIELYKDSRYEPLRFFDVDGGAIAVRDNPFGAVDRRPLYIEELLSPVVVKRKTDVAKPGKTYSYVFKPEALEGEPARGHIRQVCLPEIDCRADGPDSNLKHKGPRDEIVVSLDELIQTAEEVGASTGKTHYAAVLKKVKGDGLLRHVSGPDAVSVDRLKISQVVSLVGLVGAGKSVLANMLMVVLSKRGLRVVSLLNSVADVMEIVTLLREAGVAASPLVSKNERVGRLNELFDKGDTMLLDESASRYLETPCLLDGLTTNEEEACAYGSVPCHGLRSSGGGVSTCPYWDICPSQAMAREALESEVVVTTPNGFALMTVGKGRKAYFETVLERFDVVLFDEADRVQVQLDNSFSPEMSFQELIYNAADPTAAAMKRLPSLKMIDINEELFYDLRQSSEPVAKALLMSVRTEEVASWKTVKNEAFTSLTLFNDLVDQGLPEKIAEDIEEVLAGYGASNGKLKQAIATSCLGIDGDAHSYSLDDYLTSCGYANMESVLKQRLSFLLKVMRFDSYLRELAAASDFLAFKDESVADLYSFLRFSYARQQRYLPSSLVGNMFGMKLNGNDLLLFRQFAFGRAFMNSLPWMDTDAEGNPTGPHVLLLSGSSWGPGCLQYHVNKPVDYLLEAEHWKAEKLAKSVVKDLGLEQNVSGSGAKYRSGNLGIVLSQLMATLRMELDAEGAGKILVIVNSYREAEYARERLEALFRQKGDIEKVCALAKSPREDKERFIPRSEVYRFSDHPARILVAPAMAIERGFNIVDDTGHAVFTTLVFSVRPMGAPSDLGARYRKLNGLIESRIDTYPDSPADFVTAVRQDSWAQWKAMERDEAIPVKLWKAMGKEILVRDLIATLLVTIIQIFGRLARLEDQNRPAPHVYFADAAFRGRCEDESFSLRTLEELGSYMEWLMRESDQPEVAKALYGPFYEAFKKGI